MTELEEKEAEIKRRETALELGEKNLHTMKQLAYMEHQTQTQTIKKIAMQVVEELTSKGHVCINGERFARIETKIDTIIERQQDIKKEMEELFTGRNVNSERITTLETQRNSFIWFIGLISSCIGGIAGIIADKVFK